MILYHGSYMEVRKPEIITSEVGRDFGFGFYTTDLEEQAVIWAKRRAMLAQRRKGTPCKPVINLYEWNEEETAMTFEIKRFMGSSMEWLNFVVKCRSELHYQHDYDVVIGNIAQGNTGEMISYVMQGIMHKEDALKRMNFDRIHNQIAFCRKEVFHNLEFIKSIQVEGDQIKNGSLSC